MHPLHLFKYCPVCGSCHFEVNNEKSKKCADCGFVYYFNPSAATVAFILNSKKELLVCRRAKDPAKGTLDLTGGFIDMFETGEEGVAREVKEETGLTAVSAKYLFSYPNTYLYSGFLVHTLDQFFLCEVEDDSKIGAMDDVAESFWMPLDKINPDDFGLDSVRKGLVRFLKEYGDLN
ncbi:MAG: NUDIX domain-containing protein [Phocaeicola sp.]|nr:NUDIX domain-containing protein [Phocaeicola sp.]